MEDTIDERFSPLSKVKMVHEQLKALSSNPSKKRRKSIVTPVLDMDDPLFLPSPLAVNAIIKKKPKKSSKPPAPSGVPKKTVKVRNTTAALTPTAAPPTKKAVSSSK